MITRLLIANRGEIAVRIARSAADLGIETVAVFSEDDAGSPHRLAADASAALAGRGPAAYLDAGQIVAATRERDCQAVHPGYGFLAENASFADACEAAGLIFVGATGEQLRTFGDKARARGLARQCGAPVLAGSDAAASPEEAAALLASLGDGGAVMLKAVAGGGGRGIRLVDRHEDLAGAFERCRSEAQRAFGSGELYVEAFLPRARHLEVQVVGDGAGAVSHLGDRDCSLQRRRQKLIEIAPAPRLSEAMRANLAAAATAMASAASLRGLATFEFLAPEAASGEAFYFIEANPRLQVEHTVTEAVTGLDLVAAQLRIAGGASLADLGLLQADVPSPRGTAVEARVNLETMDADGTVRPASGVITAYEPPSGPGVRVDGFAGAGYETVAGFDSLLAKTAVHVPSGDLAAALRKTARALGEFHIGGVATNIPFLVRLLALPEVSEGRAHTGLVDERIAELAAGGEAAAGAGAARFNPADPLAILAHGKDGGGAPRRARPSRAEPAAPGGTIAVRAPVQGIVVSLCLAAGERVAAGRPVIVLEAMKMEHEAVAPRGGVLRLVTVEVGDSVGEDAVLAYIEPAGEAAERADEAAATDADFIRPDLVEALERRRRLTDEGRPEAAARRRQRGLRTARENIADLCDADSFIEFGGLTVAARRMRNSLDELTRSTPADGMIMGTGRVNGAHFGPETARCAVLSYDPTVFAGTQGMKGHEKLDRMLELAARSRLPVVFFTEGGGGRPGDSDKLGVGYNFIRSFALLGQLSGLVPIVGVNNGRCFAGNAFILGCCDVVIATKSSVIGIGGPAVIEGAGLGVFKPEDVGPVSMQGPNGVIDVLVEDEAAAVAAARQYLGYFQGPLGEWREADQRRLRALIPENHRRVYDMRALIAILADADSVLELRPQFGRAVITALIRVEGRPIGLLANNPHWLGGAIDSDGSDKAARFMQLCEAHGLPILSLCDTPGFMIGPEAEKTALIRHCARMIVVGANLTVPMMILVVRKGYGLGGLAMAGGSFSNCIMAVAWPTGEFGGMPVEGFVKLGFRDELAAIADLAERQARYEERVAAMYEEGKAVNAASYFEFDDVIDPIDSRRRIVEALNSAPPIPPRQGKRLSWVDTW